MTANDWQALLDEYEARIEALDTASRNAFANRFIGAMSKIVTLPGGPELWIDSLDYATGAAK
jgi:hypothetical protein